MRTIHLLFLAIAGAITLSSCVLPLATGDQNCVSYCTLLQGCAAPTAPSGDCSAWCSAITAQLQTEGCKAAFDEATTCIAGEATCVAASCGDQVAAATDCHAQYCTANPTVSQCLP